MWTGIRYVLTLLSVPLLAHAEPPLATTVLGAAIDLTHPFDTDTVFWPTEEGFVLERGPAGLTAAGYYYEAHRMRFAEHGGTHLDAPIHFHEGGETAEDISLSRLIGPAVVVDVRGACSKNRDYLVSIDDLRDFEKAEGRIPDGAMLLLNTGFAVHWPNRTRYLGTAKRGQEGVAELRFPGLAPEAARWLVAHRRISALGIDTASIDAGTSKLFESHRILFAAGIPAFENLASLDELPATGATLIALPMKVAGGSGAPLRAVAILPTGP